MLCCVSIDNHQVAIPVFASNVLTHFRDRQACLSDEMMHHLVTTVVTLTFRRTDLLSFSLLMILTATVFLVTQWVPSLTRPGGGGAS